MGRKVGRQAETIPIAFSTKAQIAAGVDAPLCCFSGFVFYGSLCLRIEKKKREDGRDDELLWEKMDEGLTGRVWVGKTVEDGYAVDRSNTDTIGVQGQDQCIVGYLELEVLTSPQEGKCQQVESSTSSQCSNARPSA